MSKYRDIKHEYSNKVLPSIEKLNSIKEKNNMEDINKNKDEIRNTRTFLRSILNNMINAVEEFVKNASITDENLRIYGPKMINEVNSFSKEFYKKLKEFESIQVYFEEILPIDSENHNKNKLNSNTEDIIVEKLDETRLISNNTTIIVSECEENENTAKDHILLMERDKGETGKIIDSISNEKYNKIINNKEVLKEIDEIFGVNKKELKNNLDLLKKKCSKEKFMSCQKALSRLMDNIQKEPSNMIFRKLRKENEALKKDLTYIKEGVYCLYSIGFQEKEILNEKKNKEVFYIMTEPEVTDEDTWCNWYTKIKDISLMLKEYKYDN